MRKFSNLFSFIFIACLLLSSLSACTKEEEDKNKKTKTPTPTITKTYTPTRTPTPTSIIGGISTPTPTPIVTVTVTPTPTTDSALNPNNIACNELGLSKSFKIINGTTCETENASIAKISITSTTGYSKNCSGAVISQGTILTAANCLPTQDSSNKNNTQIKIIVGGQKYEASEYITNPKFSTNPSLSTSYNYDRNDIAIIQIKGAFKVNPLPLITTRSPKLNEQLIITGYGEDEDGVEGILKAAYMKVKTVYDSGVVLAYDETHTGSCYGDLGGPAFAYVGDKLGVIGVTSSWSASDCKTGNEIFFPSVKYYENLKFILNYCSPEQI